MVNGDKFVPEPLLIKRKLIGPQIEYKSESSWADDEGFPIEDLAFKRQLSCIKDNAQQAKKSQCRFIQYQGSDWILAHELLNNSTYLYNSVIQTSLIFQQRQNGKKMWDCLNTFKMPQQNKGMINARVKVEQLLPNSFEYKYAAYKFGKTFALRDPETLDIKQTIKMLDLDGLPPICDKIIKIEKIYNTSVYERVESELKRLINKNSKLNCMKMIKHLFHGTYVTNPTQIYSTEDGLDMRFSRDGRNGYGLYFADNALYSREYAYKPKD